MKAGWIGLVALSLLAGCLSKTGAEEHPAPKRQKDVVTREELLASTQVNVDLYQAIRSLRPHFLTTPTGTRRVIGITVVYVNRVRQTGDLNVLKGIAAVSVEKVEYLNPMQSENEFGAAATGGAILVTLLSATGERSTVPDGAYSRSH
ncbi:MAG: hypothetical protein V4550_08670 [Gemmatimonadota bacterium]